MKRSMKVLALFTLLFTVGAFTTVEKAERATISGVAALILTSDAAAQSGEGGELTCGWCYEFEWGTLEPGWWHHFFDDHGDECGWPVPEVSDPNNLHCSACGGMSTCHASDDMGPCHQQCGGGGGDHLAAAYGAVVDAIRVHDMATVAYVVRDSGEGYVARYVPEGGRMLFFQTCDLVIPVATIPIPADLRAVLDSNLAE